MKIKDRVCSLMSSNYGNLSLEDCSKQATQDSCANIMFSIHEPALGCWCCTQAEGGNINGVANVYGV